MKTSSAASPLIAAIAISALSVFPSAHSEDKTSSGPANRTVLRAVPIKDHWNANSWDPSGGSLFWHAPEDRQARRSSEKQGRNSQRQAIENPASKTGKRAPVQD